MDEQWPVAIDLPLATGWTRKRQGTLAFTPPEWFRSGAYQAGPATVWSLGVTLFNIVCGYFPYNPYEDPDTMGIIVYPEELSPPLVDFMKRCLAPEVELRASLEELQHDPWLRPSCIQSVGYRKRETGAEEGIEQRSSPADPPVPPESLQRGDDVDNLESCIQSLHQALLEDSAEATFYTCPPTVTAPQMPQSAARKRTMRDEEVQIKHLKANLLAGESSFSISQMFCLATLHLWSSKPSLHIRDTDIGTYQYYDKGEPANPTDHHYFTEKQHFAESRGFVWTLRNSRPEKLRDSLKELEELLQVSRCVECRWRNSRSCQMLLSSGVLVTLGLSGGRLERLCVDRTLVGRLAADTISDAVITDRFLLLSFVETHKLSLVHLTKRSQSSPDLSKRLEKLSLSDLKISSVDLPGAAGRRVGRRVRLNRTQDVGVCWWPVGLEEARPWSPALSDGERANLVLLGCSRAGVLQVLSRIQTEGDPLDCCFSFSQSYQLLTVELGVGEKAADSCVYDCSRGMLQKLSVTSVPLSSRPVSCCRDPSESMLLLGLQDSSLVLYDARRGLTLLAQVPMLPSFAAWHPAGALLVVGDGQGDLQCFDAALAPIRLQLLAEDLAPSPTLQLSQHMRAPGGLSGLQWATSPHGSEGSELQDLLFLFFHSGPIGALRFSLGVLNGGQLGPVEVILERLRCGQAEEAVGLLGSMDWNTMAAKCYRALIAVTDHLLRQELNEDTEAQLEAALGVFYSPSRPILDAVVLEYRDPISKYARRFFHHLLRYQRFEKAFLLAVDIGARDLFMDIHYVARDKGELVLAEVAKKRANEIDAESLTTGLAGERVLGAPSDSTVPDRLPSRRWEDQRGQKSQDLVGERSDRTSLRVRSQDDLTSRVTGRGKQSGELGDICAASASGGETWDWTPAGFHIDATEDEVAGEPGTLNVVHFGLV
ncbi:hypothetical protein GJAV_G00237240 [Gymnothorax javanicus]|nr:hypothetical protein GJAV_G00237240 [Gymnothorax javanicus]